jgi:membrane associated rhomboid family serine protease
MGIYDREYYRESTQNRFSEWFACRGTVTLVAFTCGVFFLQMLTRTPGPNPFDLRGPITEAGWFDVNGILHGELWRLVTPIFLHGDPVHLLFNMFVLYWLGCIIEGVYGTKEFVTFYLVAGISVEIAEFAARASGMLDPNVPSLGASGAVTAVMILFACHFPHRQLRMVFLIPAPAWVVVCVLILIDLFGLFAIRPDNVNHVAHLFGAAIGFVYFFLQLRFSSWLPSLGSVFTRNAAQPRLKVASTAEADRPTPAPPPSVPAPRPERQAASVDEQLEAKLDNVLEKVARHGKESLSPEENDILLRASEIYKRRRGG